MRSRLWFFIVLAMLVLGQVPASIAGTVRLERARRAASNWLTDHLRYYRTWGGSTTPEIESVETVTHKGRVVAYNFRVRPQGHIVVPSRDELPPVKFYSETSYLSLETDSPVGLWMKDTELARVYDVIDAQPPDVVSRSAAENARLWTRFSLDAQSFSTDVPIPTEGAPTAVNLEPLVQTKWSQEDPYNLQTPSWYTGARTVTGCVATAAAQILRFWQWPTTGRGSHAYTWYNGQTNQTLSRDFSSSTYDWANMTLTYSSSSTSAQKNAVAKLMGDVGVAMDMDYGPNESGAWPSASAYTNYFKYKSSVHLVSRYEFSSDSAWMQVFRGEVQAGRPAQYSAWDTGRDAGHSFVVDGYRDSPSEQIHFNLGWGGYADAWYVSNNVPAGGYNWNDDPQALIGIEPDHGSSCSFSVGQGAGSAEAAALRSAHDVVGGQPILGCPKAAVRTDGFQSYAGTTAHFQAFDNGAIEYMVNGSLAGQAFVILNPLYAKWASFTFGTDHPLGYPIAAPSAQTSSTTTGTQYKFQKFEGGHLEHHLSGLYTGQTFEVHGLIRNKWDALNFANSPLGLPISDEKAAASSFKSGNGGRVNDFERGHIHFMYSTSVAYATWGGLDAKFMSMGGPSSCLGYPSSDQYQEAGTGSWVASFEGGTIRGTDSSGYTSSCGGTPVSPPVVSTLDAGAVTETSAILNGVVNPNGKSTTAYFDYGPGTSYGSSGGSRQVGQGYTNVTYALTLTGLTCNTTYHFKAQAFNSDGPSAGLDRSFRTSACPPAGAGSGLLGVYYGNKTLTGPPLLSRLDSTVAFDWGSGGVSGELPSEQFSARWDGEVVPARSETYTFYVFSDDGARLYVDGQLVLSAWTDQYTEHPSSSISLVAGRRYKIRLEYYENFGGAAVSLSWESPSTPKAVIPQSRLYPPRLGAGDLLWHHQTNGDLYVWALTGTVTTAGNYTAPFRFADPQWQIRGLADFNGDAEIDVLWHHQLTGDLYVWYMHGSALYSGSYLTPRSFTDTRWQIRGVADFNRDGKADILWHHQVTGALYVWYLNGTVCTTGSYLTPASFTDTQWQIRGLADFNRDGNTDILWHHQGNGELYVWYLNGTVTTAGAYLTPRAFTDTRWKISRVADFNGDGKVDVLWHHQLTGELYVWFLDGTVTTSGSYLTPSSFSDTNWKIVPR